MRVPLPNIHKRKGLMSTLTSHAHSVRLAFHSLREAGATWRNTAAKAHSAAVMGLCHARVNDPDDEMMNAHPLGEHDWTDDQANAWNAVKGQIQIDPV